MKRYFLFLALGLAAAIFLNQANHIFLFPSALFTLALIDRKIYRLFLRWKLWLFLLLLLTIPVLLVGSMDAVWMGLPYNSAMLKLNFLMVERSLIIMLTIKLFTSHLSPDALSRGLVRLRLFRFEQVFRMALAVLPDVRTTVMTFLRELNWRQMLARRRGFLPPLSRLIAQIVFSAGKMGSTLDHEVKSASAIALVSGKRNSGKTAYLAAIVQRSRARGMRVGGVLSHGIWQDGEKSGFNLEVVATGELYKLAATGPDGPANIRCGRFIFAPRVIELANAALQASAGSDLVIVDEYGPLEEAGGGLWPGIDFLLRNHSGPLLISVRPSLLAALQRRIHVRAGLQPLR